MDALHRIWRAAQAFVLPSTCLLCGAGGANCIDLCIDCAAELPRNHSCCARCALPLAVPAELCGECLRRPPPWDAAWAPFRYGWPLDRLESRFKFSADLAAGRVLSTLWQRETCSIAMPEWVLPVPLHRTRLRKRGYNQAHELVAPLAHFLHLATHRDVLQRRRATEAQTELDAISRRRNVRGAFELREHMALPKHVAIVDDVMTTGATLAECARVLKRAGVERVDVWALARAPSVRSS